MVGLQLGKKIRCVVGLEISTDLVKVVVLAQLYARKLIYYELSLEAKWLSLVDIPTLSLSLDRLDERSFIFGAAAADTLK